MKSRLKELKDNHEFGKGEGWEITILSEDIDWLIEQVEEKQKEIEKLKKDKEKIYEIYADI
jgi:predicted RNase H-like nuclease (RuvC/YqgF family)